MASVFNKRIFGTDLDPDIKNKLKARQLFAKKSQPNESIEFEDIDGHQVNLFEALGEVNFPIGNKWTFDTENRKTIPKKILLPRNKTREF